MSIKARASEAAFARRNDQGGGDDALYFVCGALRSGTTLLRLMIDAHPRLANPAEMDFLFDAPAATRGPGALRHYLEMLKRDRVVRDLGLHVDDRLDASKLARSLVHQLRRDGQTLSINVHRNFEQIPEVFPQARYIHIVRDPRDVARSSIGMGWAGNVFHGVDHWIQSEQSIERLRGKIADDQMLSLRHEDLLADPCGELTRICAFMGVEFDPVMLEYPATSTYAPPDPAQIGAWRRKLNDREVRLVEGKAGAMMEARGYKPSGLAPASPSFLRRFLIKQHNRIGRLKFATRRFGAGLTALEIVTRPAGTSRLRRWVEGRRNAIEALHLK